MSFYHPVLPFGLHGKTLVVVSIVLLSLKNGRVLTPRSQGQPVVSIANVAQLAVDLLIASLSLRKIGMFDPRDVVPVIGGREDGEEGITTPLECVCVPLLLMPYALSSTSDSDTFTVFGREGCKIVLIQQRSPVLVVRVSTFVSCNVYGLLGLTPSDRVLSQSRKQAFIDSLFKFVQEHRLSAVLILSGVDMSNRTDAQMM